MMDAGAPTVARPKKSTDPQSEGWANKTIIFQMRGSDEFKAWLKKLADFDATDTTEVVERSLANYARAIGFTEARPKR